MSVTKPVLPGMPTFSTMGHALQAAGIRPVVAEGVSGTVYHRPDGSVYPRKRPVSPVGHFIPKSILNKLPYYFPDADLKGGRWLTGSGPYATQLGTFRRFEKPEDFRIGWEDDPYRPTFTHPPSYPIKELLPHPDYFPPLKPRPLSATGFTPIPTTGKKTDVYPGMQAGIARAMEGLSETLFLAQSNFLRDTGWGATPALVRDFINSPLGQACLEKIETTPNKYLKNSADFLHAWLKWRFPKWADAKCVAFLEKRGLIFSDEWTFAARGPDVDVRAFTTAMCLGSIKNLAAF